RVPALLHASRGALARPLRSAGLPRRRRDRPGPAGVLSVHDLLNLPSILLGALVLAAQSAEPGERAVAELHRRAERAAPGSLEAPEVAVGRAGLGRRCLEEAKAGCAVELLGEAYALDENDGMTLAELTLAYVRAEDYDSARFYLQRAQTEVLRAPPEAYAVLGQIYDGLHRLDDAVDAWTEFARLGGQD